MPGDKEGAAAEDCESDWVAPKIWHEYFTGDDTMLCALDRIFDKATVFMMAGPSYRGAGLETLSMEAAPQAVRLRK
ncbi:hypothetical protein [Paratractidigestivibacter sp.]|uniref:hypothetical protein n=1 Tax=Paratractidigestivibacter sp. TaxID=2847316 RepID=UPI002ACB0AC9|nr:hypothetical protein [Paratractidigestivibacter sp.]